MEWRPLVPELSVTHLAQSLHFYTHLLGFEVLFARSDPPFAYLNFEGAQLMLEEIHPGGWSTEELLRPFGRGLNLQIECVDVQQMIDRLAEASYPLFRPLQEVWYDIGDRLAGTREFLVQDPDGYLLRFAQDLGDRDKR